MAHGKADLGEQKYSKRSGSIEERKSGMNKMKIAGIITAAAAGAVFAVVYFRPHVNSIRSAVLLLAAGVVVIIGMLMISASEDFELEDTDEK